MHSAKLVLSQILWCYLFHLSPAGSDLPRKAWITLNRHQLALGKSRGGVEYTRLEAKDTKKNPRPKTALPRTDPLEAKDRNARGEGHRRQVFSPNKGLKKIFSGDLQKKAFKQIS